MSGSQNPASSFRYSLDVPKLRRGIFIRIIGLPSGYLQADEVSPNNWRVSCMVDPESGCDLAQSRAKT